MSSIFPIREKVSLDREPEPRLVDLDEDTADEVFKALSSQTTRKIFLELHNQPQTASDLAKVTDTSVQNVQYHLEKLGDADLVEVVDTWYSERGSEMKVYAPQDESLVLFAGRDKQGAFRRLVNRFAGVFALLVPPSIVAGWLANRAAPTADGGASTQYAATDDDTADRTYTAAGTDEDDEVDTETADDDVAPPDDAEEDPVDTDDAPEDTGDDAGILTQDDDVGDDAPEEPTETPAPDETPTAEETTTPEETPTLDQEVDVSDAEFETTASVDNHTVELEFDDAETAAEIAAAENETILVMLEGTGRSDIMGIDPTVASAFFLGGMVVYGLLSARRRIV